MNEDRNTFTDGHEPAKDGVPVVSRTGSMSLKGMRGSIAVSHHQVGFWQQWRAFVGPAIFVSVGCMNLGNWGPGR